MTADQPQLPLDLITVHCFWGWCRHTETAVEPTIAHTMMEEHYRSRHPADIAAIVGPTNPHSRAFPR